MPKKMALSDLAFGYIFPPAAPSYPRANVRL